MKRSLSKQKGAAFERWVCKQLSLALSGGKRDDLLWRSAMSGGRATIGKKSGMERSHQVGDISAISKEGEEFLSRYVVECKHYKKLPFLQYLLKDDDSKSTIIDLWISDLRSKLPEGKLGVLIAKANFKYPIVFLVKHSQSVDFSLVLTFDTFIKYVVRGKEKCPKQPQKT